MFSMGIAAEESLAAVLSQ